jgi:response regulator RpfG family c-di-GMP phosphodiesterase
MGSPAHSLSWMFKKPVSVISFLSAIIFSFQGSVILLPPNEAPTYLIPSTSLLRYGFGLALLVISSLMLIVLGVETALLKQRLIHTASFLGMVALAYVYIENGLLLGAILAGILALVHLFFSFSIRKEYHRSSVSLLISRSNHILKLSLSVAILIGLVLQTLVPLYNQQAFSPSQIIFVILFGISILFLTVSSNGIPEEKLSNLNRLAALPWLIFAIYRVSYPNNWQEILILLPAGVVFPFEEELMQLLQYLPLLPKKNKKFLLFSLFISDFTFLLCALIFGTVHPEVISNWRLPFLFTWITINAIFFGSVYASAAGLRLAAEGLGDTGLASSHSKFSDLSGAPQQASSSVVASLANTFSNISQKITTTITEIPSRPLIDRQLRVELHSINELSKQLVNTHDQPIAAQIASTALQKSFKCSFVSILRHVTGEHWLAPIASAGPDAHIIPLWYRQNINRGLTGRAIHLQRTLIDHNDNPENSEHLIIADQTFVSQMVVPLIRFNYLEGLILLADIRPNIFHTSDIAMVEAVGAQVLAAWDRYRTSNSLTDLIKSSVTLTSKEHDKLLYQIAELSKKIVQANFSAIFIARNDKLESAYSGKAPALHHSIEHGPEPLMTEILQLEHSIRLRDLRKDPRGLNITLDSQELKTFLATPVRLHGSTIGAILAFGKRGGLAFSERDVFLLELLALQSAAAIENSQLTEELRKNLESTEFFYDLSIRITQAEDLHTAAKAVAESAFRLCHANSCGIILYSQDGGIETQVCLPEGSSSIDQPYKLIQQAIQSHQIIYFLESDTLSKVCFPLQTTRRCYGALWVEMSTPHDRSERFTEDLRILLNQAVLALERAILLVETSKQADEITRSYHQLEATYDQTLVALMSALDARDKEIEGHCQRVAQIALTLGKKMGLSPYELKALERGSLLHDIGKIGISDTILNKTEKLTEKEWEIIRLHPEIGARIIHTVPSLQDALSVVSAHQERWDGSGYPKGLAGEEIPQLARIFAVADVYDALVNDRPYRKKSTPEDALNYIVSQAGIQFDPQVVKKLKQLVDHQLANREQKDIKEI